MVKFMSINDAAQWYNCSRDLIYYRTRKGHLRKRVTSEKNGEVQVSERYNEIITLDNGDKFDMSTGHVVMYYEGGEEWRKLYHEFCEHLLGRPMTEREKDGTHPDLYEHLTGNIVPAELMEESQCVHLDWTNLDEQILYEINERLRLVPNKRQRQKMADMLLSIPMGHVTTDIVWK
jgi:hypothetical protein